MKQSRATLVDSNCINYASTKQDAGLEPETLCIAH